MPDAPIYDADFYSNDFIRNPWPHYARMRELGPVVWLPRHENFALVRHAEVADALRDHDTFISGRGVAADPLANEVTRGNSAASDGARHHAIRQATSAPLLPGALDQIRPLINESAEQLIDRLVAVGDFETMRDLATHLPLTIVRDLVGLPDYGRENMLRWANATFDLLGVQNARGKAALAVFLEQRRFAQTQTPAMLKSGSWTRRLFDLVDEGALPAELAPVSMRDYLNPSLDTTISATGQLIWRLGKNPDQWALLRARPELARSAANEAVRMASPVRSFCRHTARDVEVSGTMIPEGARVMMVFASANRDELVFERPNDFDITRNPRHHLGFGSGIHMCVGMHLAQMEMIALLEAMIPRVEAIEVGEAIVGLNNTIYSFSSLPTKFIPLSAASESWRSKQALEAPWAELTPLMGRVIARERLTDDTMSFEIEPAGGDVFPSWSPGAHIDIHVRDGVVRQYSLTGPTKLGRYLIAVQRDPQSRGGSEAIHAKFETGGAVRLSRPRNHFALDETASRYLLFSGGIGLTPILAMAWRLHELGRAFTWHASARSRSRLAWAEQIETLPFREDIRLHFDDGGAEQALNAASEIRNAPAGALIYICGPRGYMDYVAGAARIAGIPTEQVRQEHFGAEIDVNGDPFTVMAARSGRRIEVGPAETILAAVTRAGYRVETGCRNGVCGSCLTRVIEGRPDHRDMVLTDAEKAENDRIAVCCSRSKSRVIVLDI
ncbi:cytochrome P450 [Methylocapsa sp. S129]|uniref:cytochrome P450/oxidoreductase n=1 Tax=Methylocapsa sp. S129 TaxID=1641869 RepID=UPI00131EB367|nr:cytochrome P450 [Methylocapsa sp. S129]